MSLQEKYQARETVTDVEKNTPQAQKPKKKFRWRIEDNDSPPQIYNWVLYMTVFVFGIFGAARGLDEGNISGNLAQTSFKHQFGLADKTKTKQQLANLKSNIASMVQLGAIGGAMLAMYTVDKFGRINALRGVCVLWMVAVAIQISASHVGQLYAGRLLEGLAVGQTTTIGPTYLSEVAPKQIRGMCSCIFAGAVYFGISISYFANYGTALHISNTSRAQWAIPLSMKLVMAALILVLSFFFCVESPRWLLMVNRPDDAVAALSKIRKLPSDHPYVVGEISDINEGLLAEKEAVAGNSMFHIIKEFLGLKSNLYRFFVVAAAAQILGQWSGANAITIYAPELFGIVGIKGVETLKMTAILGLVKLISAYLGAFFIIDFLGRRLALYCGITLQLICALYFAIFMTIVPQAANTFSLSGSQKRASQGALAALFLSGTGWTIGFNSVQYLLGSEIFPLNIRSFAQSTVMVLHFANQFGNSKALPLMMLALKANGAFFFFSGVLAVSLFWAWFFVPEVAGRSLESMEEIFNLPWYLIGRKGPELCPDHSEINKIHYNSSGEMSYDIIEKPEADHASFVENAEDDKEEKLMK
ncbi:hypothetical protein PUMCH_004509 [Australozyma saopauloensis]|uniref:Major facilitator superfamily (MFS) profile domain-containing protein n=1 Tax=Australozyma saopauloensis TaxID=291208 RepID=A0AAX4HF01_9ASCO|nr:hypothetical protein PUMCH_004509 [[Candida] saopauloensis]